MQCKSGQIENMYVRRSNVLISIFKRLFCYLYHQLQVAFICKNEHLSFDRDLYHIFKVGEHGLF